MGICFVRTRATKLAREIRIYGFRTLLSSYSGTDTVAQTPTISDLQPMPQQPLPVSACPRPFPPGSRTSTSHANATHLGRSRASHKPKRQQRTAQCRAYHLPSPSARPEADGSGPIAPRVLSSIYLHSLCRRRPINTAWLLGAETREAAIALHRCRSFSP
jgi:hypothetical protein